MRTTHRIICGDARDMTELDPNSVDLVVTSPPYPMIKMWDETFASMNPVIGEAIEREDGRTAFELMHAELDLAWGEIHRVLKDGGIACINVGDATRSIGSRFQIYPNHSRILSRLIDLGFQILPWIIWRKPTNAPTKFMGSGMLPAGAYITLEHEFVLIARKNGKRMFASEREYRRRSESAYFSEERNTWFSDVWTDLVGASQPLRGEETRDRSAAFPLDLPTRLILMYSVYGDTVLDPFLGTGTTMRAAMILGRNSIGIEIDKSLTGAVAERLTDAIALGRLFIAERYDNHLRFVRERDSNKTPPRYYNQRLRCPVMTSQETDMVFYELTSVRTADEDVIVAEYTPFDCGE
ncbi:MAG: DNA-methyltransferase [Candidatus Thorarchaeota archaeon]